MANISVPSNTIELTFEFWGTSVRVVTTSPRVASHLTYYFRDYHSPSKGGKTDYLLRITGDSLSFEDPHEFTIFSNSENAWKPVQPNTPTLIPPFKDKRLRKRFQLLHASAAASPNGANRGVVMTGPSTSGKSTLLIKLLERGWKFISDDTVLVENGNTLYPYTRPIGIRASSLKLFPHLTPKTISAPAFHTSTGLTHMVHASDLGAPTAANPASWEWTILLSTSHNLSVKPIGPQTLLINYSVHRHLDSVTDAVCDFIGKKS